MHKHPSLSAARSSKNEQIRCRARHSISLLVVERVEYSEGAAAAEGLSGGRPSPVAGQCHSSAGARSAGSPTLAYSGVVHIGDLRRISAEILRPRIPGFQ